MTTWLDVVKSVRDRYPPNTSLKEILPEASAEWKRIKSGKHPTKGMASLTMPGKEDFTTKKSSKVFHRKGKYEKVSAEGVKRKPYHKKAKSAKKSKKSKKAKSAKSAEVEEVVVLESPMYGGSDEYHARFPDPVKTAESTGYGDPSNICNTEDSPALPRPECEKQEAQAQAQAQEGGRKKRHSRKSRKSRKTHKRSKKGGMRKRHARKSAKKHRK